MTILLFRRHISAFVWKKKTNKKKQNKTLYLFSFVCHLLALLLVFDLAFFLLLYKNVSINLLMCTEQNYLDDICWDYDGLIIVSMRADISPSVDVDEYQINVTTYLSVTATPCRVCSYWFPFIPINHISVNNHGKFPTFPEVCSPEHSDRLYQGNRSGSTREKKN